MLDVLTTALKRAWQVPKAVVTPSTTDKAGELIELIGRLRAELGKPGSPRPIESAPRMAHRRVTAFDRDKLVVCHGDPHPATH